MKERFFDFEVLPHWWLCVFGDYKENVDEGIKDTFVIVHSDMPDAREKLLSLMREENVALFGYNIKHYDLMIANAIYNGFSPEQIKIVNDIIINPSLKFASKDHIRLQSFANRRISGCVYQDLMDDDPIGGSLKDKEGNLGLSVLESSIDFNKEDLTNEDKEDLIYYCKHDVYATMYYYEHVRKPYVDTKLSLAYIDGITEAECYMNTNASLCAKILKAKKREFADEFSDKVELPMFVRDYVYDALGSNLVNKVLNNPYIFKAGSETPTSVTITENIFKNEVLFGNGGIHSTYCKNLYVESNDEWVLVNLDAASFYPSLLIFFKYLSRAVENPELFEEIFRTRITLKHKDGKTIIEIKLVGGYKLVLNTTYGASINRFIALYDRHQGLSCCRVGQLILTALASNLYKRVNGLDIIQMNTDGILVYFRRKDMPFVEKICNEWTEMTQIILEFDEVDRIWQRDVNNYLLIKHDGKRKIKGGWLSDSAINKGNSTISGMCAFVCAKAAQEYLVSGTDIVSSIIHNENLFDYTIYCKKGPTFSRVVQRYANGHEEPLFKGNRVVASTDEKKGSLYKIKMLKGNLSYNKFADIPEHCLVVNDDLTKYNFKDIKKELDYMWYIKRTMDLLDINWKELTRGKLIDSEKFQINF